MIIGISYNPKHAFSLSPILHCLDPGNLDPRNPDLRNLDPRNLDRRNLDMRNLDPRLNSTA